MAITCDCAVHFHSYCTKMLCFSVLRFLKVWGSGLNSSRSYDTLKLATGPPILGYRYHTYYQHFSAYTKARVNSQE